MEIEKNQDLKVEEINKDLKVEEVKKEIDDFWL